jgi:vacuolar-type H+-ATPase subunit C/Vma6
MNLLTIPLQAGYPSDYLLARVRGRRAALTADWSARLVAAAPAEATEETIRQGLLEEFAWLWQQMNGRLRACFAPVFSAFELRTVSLCLRHQGREPERVERLLAGSLLAASVQNLLRAPGAREEAVAALAAALAPTPRAARELRQAWSAEGSGGFESRLSALFFEQALRRPQHPLVRRFLRRLIDLRNLRALGKHLRWAPEATPRFLPGGCLPVWRLGGAWQNRSLAGLLPLGVEEASPPTPARAEAALLGAITAELRRAAREPDGVGLLLDYLWRRRLEARNLRILLLAGSLEHDRLAAELEE